jgi:hypothetical protein
MKRAFVALQYWCLPPSLLVLGIAGAAFMDENPTRTRRPGSRGDPDAELDAGCGTRQFVGNFRLRR